MARVLDGRARLAAGLPLAVLVGYQVFRVPLEWLLHRLYLEGIIPVEMTYAGRNFDIVTGLTAGALALYLASGRDARGLLLAWNCLGLALLANIVAVAVLSTPASFRYFVNGPANRLPACSLTCGCRRSWCRPRCSGIFWSSGRSCRRVAPPDRSPSRPAR